MAETQKETLSKRQARVKEAVTENDAREIALKQRHSIGIHPLDWQALRLEAFFETILGERRYLDYVDKYQQARGEMLTQLEEQAAASGFGLSRPSSSGLVVPK